MLSSDHLPVLTKLMDVAALRGQVHAANLANQNTPGYRAKAVSFEDAFHAALANGASSDEAIAVEPTIVEPGTTSVGVDGNDVAPDYEVLASAENAVRYNTFIALARGESRLLTTAITSAP